MGNLLSAEEHIEIPTVGGADIWCPVGFKCASKIEEFGLGHDGKYPHDHMHVPSDQRLKDAYEVGCPARGTMSADGACLDDGKGGRTKCFSPKRYEGGPGSPCGESGSGLCRCVKLVPRPRGNAPFREFVDGLEVLKGDFEESVPHGCSNCSRLSENETECKACYPACMLSSEETHNNGQGGIAGEMVPKCIKNPQAGAGGPPDADSKSGRPWNHGYEIETHPLKIVPHYKFWYPDEPVDKSLETDGSDESPAKEEDIADEETDEVIDAENVKMPFEVRREPMGRKEWIKMWKEAAPKVQNVMDSMVTKMKTQWSQPGQVDQCWSYENKGDDVSGKLERFLAVQRSCREMNDVASSIRGEGKDHSIRFDSGKCGNDDPRGLCGCTRSVDEDGEAVEPPSDCQFLNCYSSGDTQLDDAMAAMQAKEATCQAKVSSMEGGVVATLAMPAAASFPKRPARSCRWRDTCRPEGRRASSVEFLFAYA